jgi:hypothetical protein
MRTTASCQPLLVMDHCEYATVRLRQLDFRSASEAHGCHAALAVRAVQGAINSPHVILQYCSNTALKRRSDSIYFSP